MPCPIHGGDNPEGCGIMLKGVGNWTCFTHNCQQEIGSSIINFIQALFGFETFEETLNWCANRFNLNKEEVSITNNAQTQFIHLHKHISKKKDVVSTFFPKSLATKNLDIPSSYYIRRGYTKEILYRYDIGDCTDPTKSMFQRAVVPCYDAKCEYALGYIGRSIFEKCTKCNYYHKDGDACAITRESKLKQVKWKSNVGFNADCYLYNLWNIDRSLNYIIILEGAGDVLKLEEAGIKNSIASFGTKFTEKQRMILEDYPITRMYVAMDNDDAGQKCKKAILQSCKRLFKIEELVPTKKDFGEMSIEEIKQFFRGVLNV